jgi:adenylate cyclase
MGKPGVGKPWWRSADGLGISLAMGLAIALGAATAYQFAILKLLELQVQQLFFNLRGPVPPPANIVIVAIDEDSLNIANNARERPDLAPIQSWPWRRTAYAQAIERIMAAGARAVVVDVIFDAPSDRPQDDQQLQRVLRRYAGRVTLAAAYTSSSAVEGTIEQFVYPAPEFRTRPESIGFINWQPEIDGQFRQFTEPYLRQIVTDLGQPQTILTSLPVAALQSAGEKIPPHDGEYIYFYGGRATFATKPFFHLLLNDNWALLRKNQFFKDKIVLIGPTAMSLQDVHPTPFGKMPGVEIHANAIASLLEHRGLKAAIDHPIWQGIGVTLGLGAVGGLLYGGFKRAVPRFLAAGVLSLSWLAIGYVTFTAAGVILPVAIPFLGIGLSGLAFLGTGAFSDQMEKLRLRRTLERYVSSAIVQEVLSQPEDFQTLLQGRQLNVAVLFCDIRGFTTLSYNLPAQQLVAQLNRYLNAMVEAITRHSGTIDKFIGDAVMAEFGSPISQGEATDAMNAIRAALAMRRALADLRQQWRMEGRVAFYHGIGISYGEVIAGNIGSLKRLEYTVIGDAVNVASRVEGLTKNFWTDILITGSLYDRVQDHVDAIFIGEHALRGRGESQTRLYSLVGLKGDDHRLYQQVHEELRKYLGLNLKP